MKCSPFDKMVIVSKIHGQPSYIAPGKGRQTPWVKIFMSTERPYHFDHLLQVLKKIPLNSDFIHIF